MKMLGFDLITPEENKNFIWSKIALAREALPNFRDLAQAAMAVDNNLHSE